ncbi:hypothetical protein NFI96_008977 [Prochilodus magdalenae]|nr:hypothetical protein NFI96_008977 [Prochilodus magdalenae]
MEPSFLGHDPSLVLLVDLRSSSSSGPGPAQVQLQLRSRSIMQQYTPGVLILLLSVFSTGSESATPTVRVELHDSATLPCSERCSGVVRWIESRNPTEVLAECNQMSCRSVKEGYQMIHDQYLKGDLSLTITAADLSKRGLYTCTCGRSEVCDVVLQVEPLNTAAQVKPGEAMVLKLDLSVPVEVIYNRTDPARPSSVQICTVDGGSVQCRPDYTQRSSLISGLELRGLTVSEGGVYTVRDVRTKEVVHTCTVTVQDGPPCVCPDQGAALPGWVVPVLVVLLLVCAVSVGMILRLWSKIQQLQKRPEENRGPA